MAFIESPGVDILSRKFALIATIQFIQFFEGPETSSTEVTTSSDQVSRHAIDSACFICWFS